MGANVSPQFGPLYRSLAISTLLPLIAVLVLSNRLGFPLVVALAISALFPLADIALSWLQNRRLEPLGAMMLVIIISGIAASLITGDVHFVLMKESFGTLLTSLIFLGSLLMPKPLIFWLGRQLSTGGNAERIARWDGLWEVPRFRHGMRFMTAMWGLGYLLDAVARGIAVYTLPARAVVVLSPFSVIVVTLVLVVWTLRRSRAAQRYLENTPA
jgi:hypothetical protein